MTAPAPKRSDLWVIHATGAAVIGALTIGFYTLSVHPALRDRKVEQARRVELEDLESRSAREHAKLLELERRLASLRADVRNSQLQLAAASRVNERVDSLARLAVDNGLQVDALQPGAPLERDQFMKVPLRLSGVGAYRTCATFLHALRERFPDMGLASIELTGNPSAHDGAGRFVFNLVWYAAPADTLATAE